MSNEPPIQELNKIREILLNADTDASAEYLLNVIDQALAAIAAMRDASTRKDEGKDANGRSISAVNPSHPSCEISVVDDFHEKISNALECANLFVLKHCDKPKAVEVIQAINAGRDALRLHKPVSIDLIKCATDVAWIINEAENAGRVANALEITKAVLDAAGVKYVD